jgi:DNA-directed RNA polymerase subunit RPC12/RpoP
VIGKGDIRRIQEQLDRLAVDAARIDLDGFIEASMMAASPQAATAGLNVRAVTSAAEWAELAQLLKPFRDHVIELVSQIRERLADNDEELVPRECACPSCGERRSDELALNEDESVVCATCGRRYHLPGEADTDAS